MDTKKHGVPHSDFERPNQAIPWLCGGLQETREGRGGTYLILAGAGSGKEHVLAELAKQARVAEMRVVALSGYDESTHDEKLVVKIIRALDGRASGVSSAGDGGDPVESVRGGTLVRVSRRAFPSDPRDEGKPVDISTLAGSFRAALERATASSALVLVIDDLHKADCASVKAVVAAARETRVMRLMIVATFPCVESAEESVRAPLAEFASLAVRIRVMDERGNSAEPSGAMVSSSVHAATLPRELMLSSSVRPHESDSGQNSLFTQMAADSNDSVGLRIRCEQLIALGEAQSRDGENEAAENTLREAAALAERLHDSACLTQIVLALPAWHWPGPGEANPLALLLAGRGLVIEQEDDGRRAILMARLAAELSYAPDHQIDSAELATAAMERVLAKSDPRSELYVRLYRDPILRQPEQLSQRLLNAEAIARLAIEVGDYGACCVAALAKSSSLMMIGHMAAAEHVVEFAAGILATSQVRFHHALSAAYHTYRAVRDGRFAEAAQGFDRCRTLASEYKFPYLVDASWPTMLMPYAEEERLDELEAIAEDTVRRRPSVVVYSALLGWLKVQMGCLADAAFLLDRLAADEFANLSRGAEGVVGMAALAVVCAALHRPDCAAILHTRLLPYAELNATLNTVAVFGSIERYLGILDTALDQHDEAIRHFEKSFRSDRGSGARPWAIYSGLDLACGLARRGTSEDRVQAAELLASLETEVAGLKMKRALSKLYETREMLSGGKITAARSSVATNGMGAKRLLPSAKDGSNSAPEPAPSCSSATASKLSRSSDERQPANGQFAVFSRNGEYWHIGYEGHVFSLKHRRGIELISFLVRHPDREFFALELAHEGQTCPRTRGPGDLRVADTAAQPVLDAEAKRAYRERLREIREDLEEVSKTNDLERATKLKEEQDFLTRELAHTMGLFGRDRKFSSESERARKCVSVAIARIIRLIFDHDENVGRYLKRTIRTGNLCCYKPDPAESIDWKL